MLFLSKKKQRKLEKLIAACCVINICYNKNSNESFIKMSDNLCNITSILGIESLHNVVYLTDELFKEVYDETAKEINS